MLALKMRLVLIWTLMWILDHVFTCEVLVDAQGEAHQEERGASDHLEHAEDDVRES